MGSKRLTTSVGLALAGGVVAYALVITAVPADTAQWLMLGTFLVGAGLLGFLRDDTERPWCRAAGFAGLGVLYGLGFASLGSDDWAVLAFAPAISVTAVLLWGASVRDRGSLESSIRD